jgi:hypothetical protein
MSETRGIFRNDIDRVEEIARLAMQRTSAGAPPTGAAGGALTGTFPNPGVNIGAASISGILPIGNGGPSTINGLWYGMVCDSVTDNTAAMIAAINAANAQKKMLFLPEVAGKFYNFSASPPATNPLPAFTTALGIIGEPGGQTALQFTDTDGDCLVLRNAYHASNIYVNNLRTGAFTNPSAVVRAINSVYGTYEKISANSGATNCSNLLLEARYDQFNVTSVTGGGVSPIGITVDRPHGLNSGELMNTDQIGGNTAANVTQVAVTVTGPQSFTLNGTTGNGNYTSGGRAARTLDSYLLVHVGVWYNTFNNLQLNYLGVGANNGYGLYLLANPNVLAVVNPVGQPAGTYTGSVDHNTFNGLNIESKDICIYLSGAYDNLFHGGQLIGGHHQLYGRSSGGNRFTRIHLNQWQTSCLNFDSSCQGNVFDALTFFNSTPIPWQLGPDATFANTFGAVPMILFNSDGISQSYMYSRSGFFMATGTSGLAVATYGSDMWTSENANIVQWAWGPRSDNTGIAALYAQPNVSAPNSAINSVLTAQVNVRTAINCGGTGLVAVGVNGVDVEEYNGWQGTNNTQLRNISKFPVVSNTTDVLAHTVFKYTVPNGSTGNGSVVEIEVSWTVRDNVLASIAAGSGGGLFSGLFYNNGGGVVAAIGSPASIKSYGVGSVNLVAGTGGDANKVLVQVTAGTEDSSDWQLEVRVFSN